MDGTLVDSGDFHYLSWREALDPEGFDLSFEQFAASFGQRNDSILRGWLGADLAAGEIARIGEAKEERYRQLVREQGIVLLPGVAAWLERLAAEGWRQAIASSAPRANLEAIVQALGLQDIFAATGAAEDVQRGKPDPQIFLVAAGRLGVAPHRCVVVEDAPAGVEGGRRAGMRTIGVGPHHARLAADLSVPTLDLLPPDAFDRLMGRND